MKKIFIITGGGLLLFLSTYHLTESPPTWFDEGHIIQVAINIANQGPYTLFKVAPGEYVSAALTATTGYPVTFPIAAAFKLFGQNLLVARSVMVIFILLFAYCAFMLVRREMPPALALYAFFLLVTFAPLYGNGKNVLGEVPGLLYLTVFLLFVKYIESRETSWLYFLGAGLFLGLAVATKPIFILLLPPTFVVLLFSWGKLTLSKFIAGFSAFSAAMGLWIWIQFEGQSFIQMVSLYSNPFAIDIASAIFHNAFLFISRPEPLYALALAAVWMLSLVIRIRKHEPISCAEYIAIGFTLLTYLSFLRIMPYYRYFFLGEVLALLYFPLAYSTLWPKRIPRIFFHLSLVLLITLQLYQCFFSSWVAEYYNSHRTAELTETLSGLSIVQSIFVYQAPEIPLFLPIGMPYYQYFFTTPIIVTGEDKLHLITEGVPDMVVTGQARLEQIDLSLYEKNSEFDRYTLWKKK